MNIGRRPKSPHFVDLLPSTSTKTMATLTKDSVFLTFIQWVVTGFFLGLAADLWVNPPQDNNPILTQNREGTRLFNTTIEPVKSFNPGPKDKGYIPPERAAAIRKKYGIPEPTNQSQAKQSQTVNNQDTKALFERMQASFWHSLKGYELSVLGTLLGMVYGRHRALIKKASIVQLIRRPFRGVGAGH